MITNIDRFKFEDSDICVVLDKKDMPTTNLLRVLRGIINYVSENKKIKVTDRLEIDEQIVICGSDEAMNAFVLDIVNVLHTRKNTNKLLGLASHRIAEEVTGLK